MQRPELLAIDTRLEHARKRLSKAEKYAEPIKTDLEAQSKKLDGLKKDQRDVQKAADAHESESHGEAGFWESHLTMLCRRSGEEGCKRGSSPVRS